MMACRIPLRPLFVLVLLGWGLPALPAAASDCEKCFAVFIMPDTQNYVKGLNSQSFPGDCSLGDIYPGGFPSGVDAKTRKACHWRSVMNWICANGGGWTEPDTGHTMDIKLVMHLGDVVANNTPNQQWPFVDRAFDILDDTVTPANELLGDAACTEPMPHVAIPGNHDLDGNWVADNYPLNLFGTGGCDNSSGSGKKHRLCNTNKYQSVLGKTDNTCADSGTWLRNAQQLGACEDPLDCQEDEWFIGAGPCVADNERTDDWDGYLGDGPAGDQLGRSRAALIRAPNGRPFLFLGVEENFRPNINNFAAWVAGSTNDHLPTAAEQWPFQVLRSYAGVPTIMFSHDGLVAGLQNNFPTFTHAFPQVIAEMIGIPEEMVEIVHGDTANTPMGMGTYGSRSLAVGGVAINNSLDKIKEKGAKIAAHLLEASAEDLEYADAQWTVKGTDKSIGFGDVALTAYVPHNYPEGLEPGLEFTSFYDPANFCFPFGAHIAVVEVDIETGEVSLVRYAACDDVGNVVNPMIVDGQVHGGVTHGIGQALMEGAIYDEDGQLTNGSYMDYALPRADDLPTFETDRTVTPCPHNPLGVKGAGETGTIGSTPAVVNAVVDALWSLGVRDLQMPLTPQRVWQAIQSASN